MSDSPQQSPAPPLGTPPSPGSCALNLALESLPLALLQGDLGEDGFPRITALNRELTRLTGFESTHCLGQHPEALLLARLPDGLWRRILTSLQLGRTHRDILPCSRKDGSVFWARMHFSPLSEPLGTWQLLIEDVDLEHREMLVMRQTSEQLRALVANSRDMILMLEPDGRVSYASAAIQNLLGLQASTLVGQHLASLFPNEDIPKLRRLLTHQEHHEAEHRIMHRLRRKDGSLLWCETTVRAIPALFPDSVPALIAVTRDISKRRNAEQELQEMHLLLSSVFDQVPLGLCIISATGRIIQANRGFSAPLGYEPMELHGRLLGNIISPELITPGIRDAVCQRSSGEGFTAHLSVTVLSEFEEGCTLVTLSDQSERLELESRVREAQRLESLGTLAGGVAHDFNNLLAIIMGYGSLLKPITLENERAAEYVETILDAGRRGADVVRQLMLYANQHEPMLTETDLHSLISNAIVQASETWPADIRLDCDYAATQARLPIDTDQLGRVMEHLLRNAREAIQGKGSVRVRTMDRPASNSDPSSPCGWLEIAVIDDGCGMEEGIRARMFEPFFSRNKGPEVRGLGLAIVYGIIKAHGGRIEVDSAPGRGTRISLLLPRPAPQEAPAQKHAERPAPTKEYQLRTGGCVLLIEDEPDIGRLWNDLLTKESWTVYWARDGAEALALYQEHKEQIQLVFSDIGLPGDIDGWQLARHFREDRPKLPLVLASGWFQRGSNAKPELAPPIALIDKPYQIREVLSRLYQMLPAQE